MPRLIATGSPPTTRWTWFGMRQYARQIQSRPSPITDSAVMNDW